ncbi:hypothetical protein CP533_5331 [Ophiocordyceps camponoti-saundersi (nom. inval.)]|nr:hypothetical protein CP533_5331 [Ophiocordyceps camponoti-saundersi (nom. inval.)]
MSSRPVDGEPGEPRGPKKKQDVPRGKFSGCSRKRSLGCDIQTKTKAEEALRKGFEDAYKSAPAETKAQLEKLNTKEGGGSSLWDTVKGAGKGAGKVVVKVVGKVLGKAGTGVAGIVGLAYKGLVNAFGVPFPDLSDPVESYEWGKWYGELVTRVVTRAYIDSFACKGDCSKLERPVRSSGEDRPGDLVELITACQNSHSAAFTHVKHLCRDLGVELDKHRNEFQLALDSRNLTKLQKSCTKFSGQVSLYSQQLCHDVGVDLDDRIGQIELASQSGNPSKLKEACESSVGEVTEDAKKLCGKIGVHVDKVSDKNADMKLTEVYGKRSWPSTTCKQTEGKIVCADGKTPTQLYSDFKACQSQARLKWRHRRGICAADISDNEAHKELTAIYEQREWGVDPCRQGENKCEGGRSPGEVLADFRICESKRNKSWKPKQEKTETQPHATRTWTYLADFKTCRSMPSVTKWKLERGRCGVDMTCEQALAVLDESYKAKGFAEAICGGPETKVLCGRDQKPDEFLASFWICESRHDMEWKYEEGKCEDKT